MSPVGDMGPSLVRLLEEIAEQQHRKLMGVARLHVPRLTEDDLKNPDDYPALHGDPRFHYEDGVLAGVRVSVAAIRAFLAEQGSGS